MITCCKHSCKHVFDVDTLTVLTSAPLSPGKPGIPGSPGVPCDTFQAMHEMRERYNDIIFGVVTSVVAGS